MLLPVCSSNLLKLGLSGFYYQFAVVDVFLENIHRTTEEEVTVVITRISGEQLDVKRSILIIKIQCIYQVLALFLSYFVVIE